MGSLFAVLKIFISIDSLLLKSTVIDCKFHWDHPNPANGYHGICSVQDDLILVSDLVVRLYVCVHNMNCFSLPGYDIFKKMYLICYLKADVSDVFGRKLEYSAKIHDVM